MNRFALHHFALRFNVFHWFGRKLPAKVAPIHHATANAEHDTKVPFIDPECLRRKKTDLSHLAQAPNNSLYELLQLLVANEGTSAEIAAADTAIRLAFMQAFYHGIADVNIHAATAPTTPTEGALEELLGLNSARSHLDQQLRGNVDAFLRAWKAMALDGHGHAPA